MKIRIIAVLTVILALAALPAWAEAGWKTFNSAEHGFSLDYPDGWESVLQADALLALSKLEDALPLVIAVAAEPIPEQSEEGIVPPNLEESMASLESDIASLGLGKAIVIHRGNTELKGFPAYELDLKLNIVDIAALRMYNIIVDIGDSYIYLAYTGEQGSYEKHAASFERLKNSIRRYQPEPIPEQAR